MPSSRDRIEDLVDRPHETLAVEVKGWIDPSEPEGAAKIAKACIALRNQNGGYLLVGFADGDGAPDVASAPVDVETRFHPDVVQGIVSRYASEAFETHVHLVERGDTTFPVIEVEAGVRTPVAAKRPLNAPGGARPLVRANAVYVRSLQSNGTVSTTEATWRDWPRITEACFDNREADIGRFIRRHLSNMSPDAASALTVELRPGVPDPSTGDLARSLLDYGRERFNDQVVRRDAGLPAFGTMEVGAVVSDGLPEHAANESFMALLHASNPEYGGWPLWVDSRRFQDAEAHPYVYDGGWEAFVWIKDRNRREHLDFWRIDPVGRFYTLRAFQDDLMRDTVDPRTQLDFGLVVYRVAEAIAVALEFARAMGAPTKAEAATNIAFAFRWLGLENRELSHWAHAGRYISPGRQCRQNEVLSTIEVPVDTPASAVSGYVGRVVAELFAVFDGFELPEKVLEDLVERLITRRL